MPNSYFLLHPLVAATFILAFVGFVVCGVPIFDNPDTPWHLAAGDYIRLSGAIPVSDPWSFSAAGAPWYNISWAWDVAISWVTAQYGLMGLYLFTAGFAALIVAALCSAMLARNNIPDGFILLALLLVWYVLLSYLHPQPILMTLLLTVLFQRLLHASRKGGTLPLFFLPLLMVVWTNTHGGFITGLAMIAIYAIEARENEQSEWFKRLIGCGIVCALATLANPYGIHIVDAVMRTMGSVITPYLADWHPITIGNETNFTLFLLFFLVVSNLRDVRVPLADRILTVAWLLYALHARRNFSLFAVTAAPYLAFCIQDFARHAQGFRYQVPDALVDDTLSDRLKMALAAFAAVWIFAWPLVLTKIVPHDKFSDDPYGVRPAIKALAQKAPGARFINDYNIGGYLIYDSRQQWRVFVDGRAGTAYSEKLLRDYIALADAKPGFEKIFDAYKAQGIIAMNESPLAKKAESAGWQKIYSGDKVSAFLAK